MKSARRKDANAGRKSPGLELQAILEFAESAFVVYDKVGAIRLTSGRLGPLFELSESEQASLRDFSAFSEVLARRLAGGCQSLRPPWRLWQPGNGAGCEHLELDGGERSVERASRPVVDESGEVTGWVERYRDSTSQHELPARLLQTDKLAALGQMVAGITHELNNPLTAIMGYGHLLLERPLDARSLADVNRVCQEAERAAGIVRNLLMLARDAKLERSPVSLNEVIEQTLRLCAYEMQRAGIRVEVDLDPRLPHSLANPVQLQQVVLNLLVNSQQAIVEAGRAGRILLRTCHDADHVFLRIEDNGPGIPADLQARIFEPFFTTKPVGVGTGLGLAIVTGILRQHGAEIQVASTGREGTAFMVSLPMAQVGPEAQPGRADALVPPADRRRILVVEAEPGVGRLIVDALTEIGHLVELVSDGNEALERVKRGGYDLLICDAKMQGLSVAELSRALGHGGRLRRKPLLLIGSHPRLSDWSAILHESQLLCLAKPFLLSELKEAVTRLLAKTSQPRAGLPQSVVQAS